MPTVDTARLSHAYIVSGGSESARLETAGRIAAAAVCSAAEGRPCRRCDHCRKAAASIHPDIIFVRREKDKKSIVVDQARQIRADAMVLPNDAEKKVYIITDADTMNQSAQNALLKILEEPPKFAVFLLLAENSGLLLETVRSRCVEVHAGTGPDTRTDNEAARAIVSAALSGDRGELLPQLVALEKLERPALLELLAAVRRDAAGKLGTDRAAAAVKIISAVSKAEEYLSVNLSAGHISALLLAELL